MTVIPFYISKDFTSHANILKFCFKNILCSWEWWWMPIITALGRLRQKDHEFQANLGYMLRPYLNFLFVCCLTDLKQGGLLDFSW
jgi:hypothetical protein